MKQFQKQFDDLLAYSPNEDPELRKLRSTAFDQFKNLGIPTKKWEEWKFTDFSPIQKINYRLSQPEDLPQLSNNISERISNAYLIFISMVIINGICQICLNQYR